MFDICLIGAGKMGEAMLSAWIGSGTVEPGGVVVSEKDPARRAEVTGRYGVSEAVDAAAGAVDARVVVLAVKPQDSETVLESLKGALGGEVILMSIAAGLTVSSIRQRVGTGPSVIRVMPNLGAQVGASVSAYTVDPGTSGLDPKWTVKFLEAIGETVEVPEESMNLVTAVSGSGPAYFFLLVEALEKAGASEGLDEDIARVLARESLWGAAKVLKETGREAAELREAVSSPGGTTLAALLVFESGGFMQLVKEAVIAARDRAGDLAR